MFKGLKDTKFYTLGCKNIHVAMDYQPLVTMLGQQSVEDAPNKRLARIKEKLMPWRFAMNHNPGKTMCMADVIARRNPLHMLYVSINRTMPINSDEDFREFLELDIEEVHVAVNLINNDNKANSAMTYMK